MQRKEALEPKGEEKHKITRGMLSLSLKLIQTLNKPALSNINCHDKSLFSLAPIPQYNMPLDFQQILQSLQKGKKKQSEQQP